METPIHTAPPVDLDRLVRLVVEMREALESNRVFHTPLELRKHGGEWNEYQLDAVLRTRMRSSMPPMFLCRTSKLSSEAESKLNH